jgi:hypothetical protein
MQHLFFEVAAMTDCRQFQITPDEIEAVDQP